MVHRLRLTRWFELFLTALLVSCTPGTLPIPPNHATGAVAPLTQTAHVPAFKHIFIIVFENKAYEQIIGSDQAPYMNALAQQYGLATQYYALRHPSLPNYLAVTGGSTFNITSDCTDCFVNQANLIDQLEAAGKSWKAYMESMPRPCFVGDAGNLYRQKHNPFIYYDDVRTNPTRCNQIVPFTQFTEDVQRNTLPAYMWITPNMCNDMHDCPVSAGDMWLKTWVPTILSTPAWKDTGVLFITFDEGRGNAGCCQGAAGGRITTLVISPVGKPAYQSAISYDHYSLLRTIEDAWGLPEVGGAACSCAPPMTDFFADAAAASHP